MTTTAYIVNRKWKMAGLAFTIVYSLFTLLAVPLFAAFEDTGTGARPTVMGGTYVAAGDDVQSLMYNPAGLAGLHMREISSEYSKLYSGLSDGSNLGQYFMGYGQPIKYGGTMAFGWKQFSLDSLYTERTLSMGYGEWVTDRVAAGLALKQLYHSFEAPAISVDDNGNITSQRPTFFSQYGNSSTAYSADLGILYRWTDRHTFGVSVQDVNEPNIALNPADHEIVPKTIRAGLAYKGDRRLTLAGSLTRRQGLSNQQDNTYTGAVEKWWIMKDKSEIGGRGSLATGSRSFQQMATGASYRVSSYQVDYAFVFNMTGVTLGSTAGTHRFSFSYRFGTLSKEFVRNSTKPVKKTTVRRAKQRPAIEEMPELESASRTHQPLPVAGEPKRRVTRPASPPPAPEPEVVETPPVGEQPEAESNETPEQEMDQTAQMMRRTPKPTPPASHAQNGGPGIRVQVPAPGEDSVAVESVDLDVPVQRVDEAAAEPITPISRTQLFDRASRMVDTYRHRSEIKDSAESRLEAFTSLYSALRGYVLGRDGELIEEVDRVDGMEQAAKEYEDLKWDGASAQDRLKHLARSLETTLVSALNDRAWDFNDLRDRRYKAWLDQALVKGRQLTARGAGAHTRMLYWGQVAKMALEFERQPSEPAPVVVPTPAPVVKPTPLKSAAPAPTAEIEKSLGRPLGEGEWLYKVKEGDTLLSLAKRYYGDYNRWREIYILNQDRLGRGGNLRPGQWLLMPKK